MPQYVPALPVAFFNFALDNFPRELESFLNLPVSLVLNIPFTHGEALRDIERLFGFQW